MITGLPGLKENMLFLPDWASPILTGQAQTQLMIWSDSSMINFIERGACAL